MKNLILSTHRLYLREMTPDDAEQAYLLNADPDVVRYTGDGPFESVEDARSFLERYDHYRTYGFGRWATIRQEDDAFLGWCGLKYIESKNEYDLGYRLHQRYWNMGYATEAARACLDIGFNRFQMPMIVGRVIPDNIASAKVLMKLGMTYRGTEPEDHGVADIYEMSASDFKR